MRTGEDETGTWQLKLTLHLGTRIACHCKWRSVSVPWERLSDALHTSEKHNTPSLGPLRTVKLDDAPRNEEKSLWSVMSINNLSIIALDDTIEHVDVRPSDDQQTRCVNLSDGVKQ